jgi:hypothetical protein
MEEDQSRRFTDREVALVLKKASEIGEREGSGSGGGLSLADLHEIAREVGISADAISEAVAGLARGSDRSALVRGSPLVRRSVHAVPGELSKEGIGRLVALIDEKTASAGTVAEALGSLRWTSSERFSSTQVSITPERGETTILVVEKATPQLRRILHLVPASWGLMLAGAVVAAPSAMGAAQAVGIAGLGAIVGLGAGRAVWSYLSGRAGARVERLAADLSREANASVLRGLVAAAKEGSDPS